MLDATKNCSIFKNYFSSPAQKPRFSNIVTESKIASYYDNIAVSKDLNFQLLGTSEKILGKYFQRFKPI